MQIYNTLTRKQENFETNNTVKMYNCGPTVYDFPHIGNYRAYVFADLIKRYLKYKDYKVYQVMNITDVDDKTIKNSRQQGKTLQEFTEFYTKGFMEDLEKLNIDKADVYPKATETIPEMVELIKKLLEKGYAYTTKDGIYFSISKFPEYGKLTNIDKKNLKAGARVNQDEYEKDNVSDFALWKFWSEEDGDVYWETELGTGRPGWHIECSAMSMKYLGKSFDIHTGGVDNMFPHHENEIAQSEAANGVQFVRYWMHCEHLLVENKKMSKSLGNFYTLRDILQKGYRPDAIRYVLLATHYRQQLNFTFESLAAAKQSIERLREFVAKLKQVQGVDSDVSEIMNTARQGFETAMDDDLNTSAALASIFNFVKEIHKLIAEGKIGEANKKDIIAIMEQFDLVLGVIGNTEEEISDEEKKMIEEREEARKNKDFARADELRDTLKARGIILEDSKEGVRWRRVH